MSKPNKDAKRRRRAKRLAERAGRFESHAALVVERQGDPGYAQKTRRPDGSYAVTLPPEMTEMLARQRELFREKFGRDVGPDDPIFFDPDADEPVPVPVERFQESLQAVADGTDDPELRALALASLDVGYMVTEMNQHLFTAHEVEAFGAAVAGHLEGSDLGESLAEYVNDHLLDVVGMLADGSAEPDLPRLLIEQLLTGDGELDDEQVGAVISLMVMLLLRWLVAAREAGVGEDELTLATQWVADNLGGIDYAGPAATVAMAVGGGEGRSTLERSLGTSDPTVNDLHELLGQDFGPAMMWLCAGMVATVGAGDVDWLRTIDATEDEEG
jgi:hypothetical protein